MAGSKSRRTARKQAPKGGEPPLVELGVTGLKRWGGTLREEYLSDLKGKKARKVYREMIETDPTIAALLFAIKQLIRSARWAVQPADGSDEAREVAHFLETCIEDLEHSWADFMSEVLSFLVYGFALFEINYKVRRGPDEESEWYRSAFSDGRIGWRSFAFRAQETISRWDFDSKGRVRGAFQVAPPDYKQRYLPLEKCLLFRTESVKGSPEGRSILRAAYVPYYYKKRLQTIEAIGVERDLAGLPVIYAPIDLWDSNEPRAQTLRDELLDLLAGLRRDEEEGVLMPRDPDHPEAYKLELLSAAGSRQFDVEEIIKRYDRAIAQTVLADFIMLGEGERGSWALMREKRSIFEHALLGWLDVIRDTLNQQAVGRLMEYNGIPRELWPRLQYHLPRVPDVEDVVKILDALAKGGAELFPDEDLERWLRDLIGAPPPKAEE